jgi:hypothetical protein
MNDGVQLQEDKERLQQILSQKEYMAYRQGGQSSSWDWLRPIWNKIKSLFPHVEISHGIGTGLAYGIVIAAIAVAAFAIYWFSRQLIRQKRLKDAAYLPEKGAIRSYGYYWREAAELATSKLWREGVRFVFLTLLFCLEERGRIRVEKWKTNWEYASELAETEPSLSGVFRDCSLLFERIWYGKEEVTESDFTGMYERVAQVVGKGEANRHA